MEQNIDISKYFRDFFIKKDTLEESQNIIKKFRNKQILSYSIKTSRCIWMSLILYKFKEELNVNEVLWTSSRQLIIEIIKNHNQPNILDPIVKEYIKLFDIWKKQDEDNFILEIASIYYNIILIKKNIEETNNNATISEWTPHYNKLLEKIRFNCSRINMTNKLDELVELIDQEVQKQKYSIVKEIMEQAYWDSIEVQLAEQDYSLVLANLSEIKMFIIDIIPNKIKDSTSSKYLDDLNDIIDLDYIKSLIENNLLDEAFITSLFVNIITILKNWDSADFEKKYSVELDQFHIILNSDHNNNQFITYCIKKLMILTLDLKNRKAIWNKLINNTI